MRVVFTICSNNYLGQAIVLGQSLRRHDPQTTFVIGLADRKSDAVDYAAIPFEVLPIETIEPRAAELAAKYDIVELNTCIKPRIFEHLLAERGADQVAYLDPDVQVFAPLAGMDALVDPTNFLLTPHALTPVPLDGRTPAETSFLKFGVYNLGFIAIRRGDEAARMLAWWKERTYAAGYIRPDAGMFVDQLWVNLVPILFRGARVVHDPGWDMAPWNLHERSLVRGQDGAWWVEGAAGSARLAFFHFSSFRLDTGELPLHHYDRYKMAARPDLTEIYAAYNQALKDAGYAKYIKVPWAWARPGDGTGTGAPKNGVVRSARRALGRGLMWGLQRLPASVTERAYRMLRDARE